MKNLQKDQIFEVNSVYTLSKKKLQKLGSGNSVTDIKPVYIE